MVAVLELDPVRGNCVKFAPNPAATAQPIRPTAEEQLVLRMYEEPFAPAATPRAGRAQAGTGPG